ncbi:ATP-binding protein [Streptomyces sp. NPDC094153]|uniref:ATP-binding protein n=1 Tax=Streptomyces sp. NPDC094153 TaxID=3366058 RepID=UPI00381F1598
MSKRDKKKATRKRKTPSSAPRTVVHIAHVAGGINASDRHEESAHVSEVDGGSHVTTSIRPAQLPADDPEFVGRTQEIAELLEFFTGKAFPGGAVSISGQPGVGKTALATRLAHTLAPSYPDAQIYVNLNGADGKGVDLEQVIDSILRALGLSGSELPETFDEKINQYRSELAVKRALIFLDNAADESQVRPLLPGNSACATIVTSRNNLSGLVGVRRSSLSTLSRDDSIGLLCRIIDPKRVHADSASGNLIVELCGGLPLALRITANKLRDRSTWTLAYYADRLRDERRKLQVLQAGDLAVRASFTLSYDGLSVNSKKVFRTLGVVPTSSFSSELVANLSGIDEIEVEDILEHLLDANLVQLSPQPGRYRLHDLIRAFARERLESEEGIDHADSLTLNMAKWYADKVDEASDAIFGGRSAGKNFHANPQAATDWLEIEVTAIAEVVAAAYRNSLDDLLIRITSNLTTFFQRRYHPNVWRTVTSYAVQSARRLKCKQCLINALIERIKAGERTHDHGDSLGMLDEARQLSKELGSPRAESKVLTQLAKVASDRGKYSEAEKLLQQSLKLLQRGNDPHPLGHCYLELGEVYLSLEDTNEAKRYYEMARLRFLASKDRHCQGTVLRRISKIHLRQNNLSEAFSAANMAVQKLQSVHDLHCLGMAHTDLARVYVAQDESSRATEALGRACDYFKAVHDDGCLVWALGLWASLEEERGHTRSAEEKRALARSIDPSRQHRTTRPTLASDASPSAVRQVEVPTRHKRA